MSWIADFLRDRRQRVVCNGEFSSWSPISSGVPQGSVLGPVLFCMAIDDLAPHCRNTFLVKYADDASFIHFVRTSSDDFLQQEWDNLTEWSRRTELPLNVDKCEILNIVTKKNFFPDPVFTLTGVQVKQVDSLSFLGVTFSADLKWNLHFDSVSKKAMRRIFIIRNLRKCRCPPSLMRRTYNALIRSILLYAYPCLCNSPSYLQNRLLRVEKRVSRIIGEEMSTKCPRCRRVMLEINVHHHEVSPAPSTMHVPK